MRAAARGVAALVAGAVVLACCGGDGEPPRRAPATVPPTSAPPGPTTTGAPPPAAPAPLASVRLRAVEVATMDEPVAAAVRPGDTALYVAERPGRVRPLRDGRVGAPILDLSGEVSTGGERGLLGLAFSNDARFLYVNYTNRAGDTRIEEVDLASGRRRVVLAVDQPYPNHNGGQLAVRPDGTLWIGLGDGGSAGDPHQNAQNLGSLLGKILRIDPRPADGAAYRIPPDNPFVGRAGARPEVWAYGLRNPWRFSFDALTGDLWIGDVGQNAWEEVDFEPAGSGGGRNYGWNLLEGTHPYEGGRAPADAVPPILEYSHREGIAVTGGYVYRGSAVAGLAGAYLYSDYGSGRVLAVRQSGGRVVERADTGVRLGGVTSFAEDASRELYVFSLAGGVYRLEAAR